MLERGRVRIAMSDCHKGWTERGMVKRMSFRKRTDAIVWKKVEGAMVGDTMSVDVGAEAKTMPLVMRTGGSV